MVFTIGDRVRNNTEQYQGNHTIPKGTMGGVTRAGPLLPLGGSLCEVNWDGFPPYSGTIHPSSALELVASTGVRYQEGDKLATRKEWDTGVGIIKGGDILLITKVSLINDNEAYYDVEVSGDLLVWHNAHLERKVDDGTLYEFEVADRGLNHNSFGKSLKPEPKNNDGRTTCFWCGVATRNWGGVHGAMTQGQVCTNKKCGK